MSKLLELLSTIHAGIIIILIGIFAIPVKLVKLLQRKKNKSKYLGT